MLKYHFIRENNFNIHQPRLFSTDAEGKADVQNKDESSTYKIQYRVVKLCNIRLFLNALCFTMPRIWNWNLMHINDFIKFYIYANPQIINILSGNSIIHYV